MGFSRDELREDLSGSFGELRDLRFGKGRGSTADYMLIDFISGEAATKAAHSLNGSSRFGRKSAADITPATKALIERSEKVVPEKKKLKSEDKVQSTEASKQTSWFVEGVSNGKTFLVYDLNKIGLY